MSKAALTSNLEKVNLDWKKYYLPESMNGMTFLDVGCWAGGFCVGALRRGAKSAVGIDIVKSPMVQELQKEEQFTFLPFDIFSDKYLELPMFDVVLCRGVLYRVENPISLLFRLKLKTIKLLILETAVLVDNEPQDIPLLRLFPLSSVKHNYSNWWVPNKLCMEEMFKACEFDPVKLVYEEGRRACFHAVPKNEICKKILPRHERFMNV